MHFILVNLSEWIFTAEVRNTVRNLPLKKSQKRKREKKEDGERERKKRHFSDSRVADAESYEACEDLIRFLTGSAINITYMQHAGF